MCVNTVGLYAHLQIAQTIVLVISSPIAGTMVSSIFSCRNVCSPGLPLGLTTVAVALRSRNWIPAMVAAFQWSRIGKPEREHTSAWQSSATTALSDKKERWLQDGVQAIDGIEPLSFYFHISPLRHICGMRLFDTSSPVPFHKNDGCTYMVMLCTKGQGFIQPPKNYSTLPATPLSTPS